GKYPGPDELLRDCASAVAWARATGSEWRLAPGTPAPVSGPPAAALSVSISTSPLPGSTDPLSAHRFT
ncbi:hypothetical protein ACWC5I_31430, partial [Kitasatospora sp. NPDC001574]